MRICPINNSKTNCTENCEQCLAEIEEDYGCTEDMKTPEN